MRITNSYGNKQNELVSKISDMKISKRDFKKLIEDGLVQVRKLGKNYKTDKFKKSGKGNEKALTIQFKCLIFNAYPINGISNQFYIDNKQRDNKIPNYLVYF